MEVIRSLKAEIKARGQLTIPKKIREMCDLEEGQAVSIIPIGNAFIITPQRLALDDVRKKIKKMLKNSGVSIEDLLTGLKEERKGLFSELYGSKIDQNLS
jgi:AbrB family looped-hinge helix DNA binding protein